jgi:hypothetical protein
MKIGSGILLNDGGRGNPALGFISRPTLGIGHREGNMEFCDRGTLLFSAGIEGIAINRKLSILHNPISGGVLTSDRNGGAEWQKRLDSGTLDINKYMEYKDFEIPITFSGFTSIPNILHSCPIPATIKNKNVSGFRIFPDLFTDYKIQTDAFDVVEFGSGLGICYLDTATESLRFVSGSISSVIDIDCLASFSIINKDMLRVLYISFSEGNEEWRYAESTDGINWNIEVVDTALTPLGFLPNYVKLVDDGEVKAVYLRETGTIIVKGIETNDIKSIEGGHDILAVEADETLNILTKNPAGKLELFTDFKGAEFDFVPNSGKSSSDMSGGRIVTTEAVTNKVFIFGDEKTELGTATSSGYPRFMGDFVIYNERNSAPSEKRLIHLATGQSDKILQHMNFYSEHLPVRRGDHHEIFFLSSGSLYSVKYFEGTEISWMATL